MLAGDRGRRRAMHDEQAGPDQDGQFVDAQRREDRGQDRDERRAAAT